MLKTCLVVLTGKRKKSNILEAQTHLETLVLWCQLHKLKFLFCRILPIVFKVLGHTSCKSLVLSVVIALNRFSSELIFSLVMSICLLINRHFISGMESNFILLLGCFS